MKKGLCLILAVAMMIAAFTACGGGGGQSGESGANANPGGETVQIDFWVAQGKSAIAVLNEIIDEFNASQSTYKVVPVVQADYDETFQKIQAGIAGKNAPPLALLDSDKAIVLDEKGLLAPFSPLMEADADFDRSDYIEVFFDQGVNKEGTVYAMPAYGTTQVMYYNRQLFADNGIDPESIKTWQDLETAAKKIAVVENGETVVYGWEPMWKEGNLIDASYSNGGRMISEDGKTCLVNSPEWVEVWDSFRRWIHEDKIMRIHFGGQGWEYWYKTMDDALEGRAGGYTGSSGDQADIDFSILGAFEQPGFGSNPSAPAARVLQVVMPSSATEEQQKGAYEFAKFYASPEMQIKWTKGTGYVMVRKSAMDMEEFTSYTAENPHAAVPVSQALHGSKPDIDPTNMVYDALKIACDKIEIDNIPAQEALDEAQRVGQQALDEYWASQG